MIERLSVANFKAIGPKLEIDCAPLTLLVGPNGSGKSSLIEGLCILAQSARPDSRIGLIPNGRLVELGEDLAPLFHKGDVEQELHLGLRWRPPDPSARTISAWYGLRGPKEPFWECSQGITEEGGPNARFETKKNVGQFGWLRREPDAPAEKINAPSVDRFLDERTLWDAGNPTADQILRLLRPAAGALAEFLKGPRLRHLGALRGGDLIDSRLEGSDSAAGRFGESTLRLLSRLTPAADRQTEDVLDRWTARFGLKRFRAGAQMQTIDARFEDPYTGTRHRIDKAGFGSQQALPILADLVDAPPGSSVLIEEIEHSLHPAWVRLWAETLVEAVTQRRIQVVATTHAPDLVLAVALAVRQGRIEPDAVVVHELERNEHGVTASPQRADKRGRFERGWIRTFAEAEQALLSDLLSGNEDEPATGER